MHKRAATVRGTIGRHALLLPVVLSLAAGCAGNTPSKQLESAESWAATTRELAIQRRVEGVGRAYAADLLDAGRQRVRKLATSIDPSKLPTDARAAPAAVARLDTLMGRTAESVRRGDVVALGLDAAAADALGDTLRALRERVPGQ
jgi:hypothetical protein